MNSISIAGRIGKDPEIRKLQDGSTVASFAVADDQGKDKPTIWWRCSLFGKRADALQQYLTKGSQVTVVGNVTEREYTDKEGQPRKAQDVRVQDIALQGGKRDEQPSQREQAPREQQRQAAPQSGTSFDDMDADIPFATSCAAADPLMNDRKALRLRATR